MFAVGDKSASEEYNSVSVKSEGGKRKKRLRPVVVCTHCRKRKIKCDKQTPCFNCVKVNLADSCTYDPHVEKKPGSEYTMEIQLPLSGAAPQLQAAGAGKGFVGLFTLGNGSGDFQAPKRPKSEPGITTNGLEASAGVSGHTNGNVNSGANSESGHNGTFANSAQSSVNPVPRPENITSRAFDNSTPFARMNAKAFDNAKGPDNAPALEPRRSLETDPEWSPQPRYDENGRATSMALGKSEIELLKERLNQIERSLLGSATRPLNLPEYAPNISSRVMPPLYNDSRSAAGSNIGAGDNQGIFRLPALPHMSPGTQGSVGPGQTTQAPPPLGSGQIPPLSPGLYTQNPQSQVRDQSMLPPLNAANLRPDPLLPFHQIRHLSSTDGSVGASPSISSSSSSSSYSNGKLTSSTSVSSADTPKAQFLGIEEFYIGTNLYANAADTMNFFEKYSSVHYKDPLRRINFGPFAWSSLMRRDNGLLLVWDYILEQKGKSANKDEGTALVFAQQTSEITQETTNTIINADKFTEALEKQFQKRALQTDGYDDLIPYNSIIKARQERDIQKQNLNRTTLPLGLTFYDGQIDRELQLIEKIQRVLPKKRVIWKLIYRYFNWVYTYIPFLDEEYFRRDVARIIGPVSYEDEPVKELKIERKLDLATVGILFCVLRLSYLSLFSNNSELNEQILNSTDPAPEIQLSKYLMQNPININTIDVAQLCLDQFLLFRRANFTVMQLTLYLRLYHTYAPEDGDGADGGDSQVLSATLIQMAYSLGLNREPDEQSKDLKINSLSRKIWFFLVLSDVYYAFTFGNPMSTDPKYSDTKLPFYVRGGENLIDSDRERLILDRYNGCVFLFPLLSEVVNLTLNIKARVPVLELCTLISKCELEWHLRYGTLKDCLTCNGKGELFAVERNFKVKVYLSFKAFLVSIFFHIFLYYEPRDSNMAFFYMRKLLLITTADIMPHYSALLGKSEVISDMIINPTVECAVHKANMVYLAAMVRVNFVIFHLKQNTEHSRRCKEDRMYLSYFQLLCQVSSCLTRAAEYTISAISKISNRYYYAWRITKGQTLLLKIVTSTKFYEENYHNAYLLYSQRYSPEQIEELIKICENTLSKFRHSEFCTYGFSKQADKHLFKNCSPAESTRSESLSLSTNVDPNNVEIDKLWLQVLSMKHDQLLAGGDYQDNPVDSKTPMPPKESYDLPRGSVLGKVNFDVNTPAGLNDVDRFGYDIEMANKFDMFSDMPFDQMFNF